jgi:hypothetical protein
MPNLPFVLGAEKKPFPARFASPGIIAEEGVNCPFEEATAF